MADESVPVTRQAYAKINLTFEVIGRRDDGYHEIVSVMQAISLCDVLGFVPRGSLYLACNVPELVSPNNLAIRAARLLQSLAGCDLGAAITLDKGIPVAGGLGGGSSDAAAVLRTLNDLWGVGLSRQKLQEAAGGLGSDVPFFCCGSSTALAEGRGEKVTALPALPRTWMVLLVPPMRVADKTRRMYALLDASRFSRGEHARRMVESVERLEGVASELCYNVFDDIAFSFFAGLDQYSLRFREAGAREVHVAGAGPVLFAVADDRAQGLGICGNLKKERMESYLVETL